MTSRRAALVLSGFLALGTVTATGSPALANRAAGGTAAIEAPVPSATAAALELKVRTVVRGLQIPWDVQSIGGGSLLVTERDKARLSVVRKGKRRTVRFPSSRCGSRVRPG